MAISASVFACSRIPSSMWFTSVTPVIMRTSALLMTSSDLSKETKWDVSSDFSVFGSFSITHQVPPRLFNDRSTGARAPMTATELFWGRGMASSAPIPILMLYLSSHPWEKQVLLRAFRVAMATAVLRGSGECREDSASPAFKP